VQWLPALANIAPPNLRRLQHTKRLIQQFIKHPEVPLYEEFTVHSLKRLKPRHPIWDLEPTKDTMVEIWKKRWKNSGVRNVSLIDNPELSPGFQASEGNMDNTKQSKNGIRKMCNYLMHK